MDQDNLFASFPSFTKEEWIAKATTDLKGGDFDEKLVWETAEGLSIMPFYSKEDLSQLDYLKTYQNGSFQEDKAHLGARNWQNRQIIKVDDEKIANQAALLALNQGVDAIEFDLQERNQYDFDALFKEILFPYCSVSFHVSKEYIRFLQEFDQYITKNQIEPSKVQGSLWLEMAMPNTNYELIQLSEKYPHFKCLSVGHTNEDQVTERIASLLLNSVSTINALLTKSAKPSQVFKDLEFVYQLSNNYFFEIAALRAIRLLVSGIAKSYGLNDYEESQVHIHAKTSIVVSEETKSNPEWNMLSNTNQAMAAIIGGCNSLSILPHTLGIKEGAEGDSFANRIARNVSNILREEAYFDKVADPAAGSYYVEQLTHQLAEKSWELFQSKL